MNPFTRRLKKKKKEKVKHSQELLDWTSEEIWGFSAKAQTNMMMGGAGDGMDVYNRQLGQDSHSSPWLLLASLTYLRQCSAREANTDIPTKRKYDQDIENHQECNKMGQYSTDFKIIGGITSHKTYNLAWKTNNWQKCWPNIILRI